MSMYNVDIYSEPSIKGNVKYRNSPFVRGTIKASKIVVSNGNFSNKDIWSDNSVELNISWVTAQESNYIVITYNRTDPNNPNITIPWTKIAGEIISTQYINDSNVNISYIVDHYTTAQLTKELREEFFTNIKGLCSRTNLTYGKESCANLQPEPYAGSDTKVFDYYMSSNFNREILNSWGLRSGDDVIERGFCVIVWISNFAATTVHRTGGTIIPWVPNACVAPPPKSIYTSTNGFVESNTSSTWEWYGSFSKGYPTLWTNLTLMNSFITGIQNTVGQEQEIPAKGYGNLNNTRWAVIQDSYYTSMGDRDSQVEPLTQTQLITSNDIFNIQIVPLNVAINYQAEQLTKKHSWLSKWGLNNFNPMKDERDTILPDGTIIQDFSKSKLMTYPYWYHKLITNIGNEILLIPQTKVKVPTINDDYTLNFQYNFETRFIGGDKPRLMISVLDYSDKTDSNYFSNGREWNTIWEFPNIPWQSNVNSEQQLQAISSALNRTSQIYSSIIGASVKGTGFMSGYRSGTSNAISDSRGSWHEQSSMRSGFQTTHSLMGIGAGVVTDSLGLRGSLSKKYKDDANVSSENAKTSSNNIIANSPHVIVGEDNISALLTPPVKILRCGYTDGELFGFARYLDRQGQSANIILNPITNNGDIFGGHAYISSVGNKTYYQFYDLDIDGTMPVFFKDMITQLFVGGVYLINE